MIQTLKVNNENRKNEEIKDWLDQLFNCRSDWRTSNEFKACLLSDTGQVFHKLEMSFL